MLLDTKVSKTQREPVLMEGKHSFTPVPIGLHSNRNLLTGATKVRVINSCLRP